MTKAEFLALLAEIEKGEKKSKYSAKKCIVDGIKFDSLKEARRYFVLASLERSGKIRKLERQVWYRFALNDVKICAYVADFVYEERREAGTATAWVRVVEDAKGMRTREYRIKAKLMQAFYGITIAEV